MLGAELLCELLELRLGGVDLFLQQAGSVLKVVSDVTHCLPLVLMAFHPTTELAGRFQRKTN